jgi:hypothetical protein
MVAAAFAAFAVSRQASVRRSLWVIGLVVSILGVGASSAAAQEFRQVPGTLQTISAGAQSVWGIDPSGSVYRYRPGAQIFAPVPGAPPLTSIAVGGGTLAQLDEVWGANIGDGSNQVYRFNPTTQSFDQVDQVPGEISHIWVGPGYHSCHRAEVWGSGYFESLYRFNFCTGVFEQVQPPLDPSVVPTNQIGEITIGADGDVWGEDEYDRTYKFDFNTGTFGYMAGIDFSVSAGVTPYMWKMAAGGNGAVWGVGSTTPENLETAAIYRVGYSPVCSACLGGYWYATPGPQGVPYVGGEGVWLVQWIFSANRIFPVLGPVYRFDESSQGFVHVQVQPRIDKSIPVFQFIAVGSGAGVWALDTEGHIYVFISQ